MCAKETKSCGRTAWRSQMVPEHWLRVVSGRAWGGGEAGPPHQALLISLLAPLLQRGCPSPAEPPQPQGVGIGLLIIRHTVYLNLNLLHICGRCMFFVSLIIIWSCILAFFLPPLVPLFLPSFLEEEGSSWFGDWN